MPLAPIPPLPVLPLVKATQRARCLRRKQTKEEKQLWHALRAGRFAGFKFRRQHPVVDYFLDFYCPCTRLAVELDGFQHGVPDQMGHDAQREKALRAEGIQVLRFWNRQWRQNREGVLLSIWLALYQRTGCCDLPRMIENRRFIPPNPEQLGGMPKPEPPLP